MPRDRDEATGWLSCLLCLIVAAVTTGVAFFVVWIWIARS